MSASMDCSLALDLRSNQRILQRRDGKLYQPATTTGPVQNTTWGTGRDYIPLISHHFLLSLLGISREIVRFS